MPRRFYSGGHVGRGEHAERLAAMRRDPAYFDGKLIDAAADIAINVGRPARRDPGGYTPTRFVLSATVDYEAINERYEQSLQAAGADGWTEAGQVAEVTGDEAVA